MHPVPAFVRQSDRSPSTLGLDPTAEHVLEVVLLWNDFVLDVQHRVPGGDPVVLGAESLQVPDHVLPHAHRHTLARWRRGRWEIELDPTWDCTLERDGEPFPLTIEGDERVQRLEPGLSLWASSGDITLRAHLVRRSSWVDPRGTEDPERTALLGIFGVLAVAGMLAALLAWTAPPPSEVRALERRDELVEMIVQLPPPPPPAAVAPAGGDGGDRSEASGSAQKGPEDQAGGTSEGTPTEAEQVESAGLLGAWDDAGITESSGVGSSYEVIGTNDAGPSKIRGIGFQRGGGGDCTSPRCRGTGPGDAEGTGDAGTRGRGPGDGFGDAGLGPRSEGLGWDPPREVVTLGCMERSVVDEVVKMHLTRIRYCYQRELQRSPSLAGTISMRFSIARDGSVSQAKVKSSSVGNAAVEECLVDRFLKMRFPAPKGCQTVLVTYPFSFFPEG